MFVTLTLDFYLKRKGNEIMANTEAIEVLIKIIQIVLFFVGFLFILSNFGFDISTLLAGLGVGGIAFALAAQDILKNFFAGIALIFDDTFRKGDFVEFQKKLGLIEEIRLRTTKIRTFDGILITLPNSLLADNVVENLSKIKQLRVSITIGLVFQTSKKKIEEAKKIIEKAIKLEKQTDKKSFWIWLDGFGDYSLNLRVIYYGKLNYSNWPEAVYFKDRINLEIKKNFEKAKIEMAFPTQTLEIKKQK